MGKIPIWNFLLLFSPYSLLCCEIFIKLELSTMRMRLRQHHFYSLQFSHIIFHIIKFLLLLPFSFLYRIKFFLFIFCTKMRKNKKQKQQIVNFHHSIKFDEKEENVVKWKLSFLFSIFHHQMHNIIFHPNFLFLYFLFINLSSQLIFLLFSLYYIHFLKFSQRKIWRYL